MKHRIQRFDQGIFLGPPNDAIPEGALFRGRGLHPLNVISARSRNGSSLLYALNAHSIHYAFDIWHMGVGTELYRAAVAIKSGLSGSRLSFATMPPTAAQEDQLFVAGGGSLFKVDNTGTVTNWGIAAPASAPSIADGGAGGSMTADSDYSYQITYYNDNTGHRSNGNGTDISVTLAVGSGHTHITSIPSSSDSQVTHVEIWRTIADGTLLFYLTRLVNGTATYEDTAADTALSSTELPTANLQPYSWFDDCLGPFNASMFWITRTEPGQRGRVYYSPIGRPESIEGFLEVTNDDDPLQKLISWSGMMGVISNSRLYQIIGTNPYIAREISGVPGTSSPHTVIVTPTGVVYEAADGLRRFDGTTAPLVARDRITRLFRGDSAGDLTDFVGTVATYARDEYIISDGSQTLALDLAMERVRDLGVGLGAVTYSPDADIVAATINGNVLDYENEDELTDNDAPISFRLEPPHIRFDYETIALVKRIIIDARPNGQTLTGTMLLDDEEIALGTVTGTTRKLTEFTDIDRIASRVGVRITGSLTAPIEVYDIDIITADTTAQGAGIMLIVNIRDGRQDVSTLTVPGHLGSNKQSIIFDIENASPLLTTRNSFVLERLFLDINTSGENVTPIITLTDTTLTLPTVNDSRHTPEIPINRSGRITRVTLSGDFTKPIKLYRIELDIYRTGS